MVSHLAARVQRISHRASNYREITSRLKSLHRWNPQQHSKKQRDHNSSASRLRSASSASSVSSVNSSSASSASVLEKEQKKKNTEICREQKDEDEDVLENTEQEENLNNKYNKYEDDDDAGYASSSSVSSRSSTSSSHPNNPNPNPNPNSNRVYGPLTEPLDAYDYVFWLGDLNYRVHLKSKDLSMKGEKEEDEKDDKKDVVYGCDTAEEYREVLRLVNGHEWSLLQRNDQLTREMSFENVFCGYNEEKIIFAPTYRMNKGKSGYSNKRYHQQQEIICRIVNSLFFSFVYFLFSSSRHNSSHCLFYCFVVSFIFVLSCSYKKSKHELYRSHLVQIRSTIKRTQPPNTSLRRFAKLYAKRPSPNRYICFAVYMNYDHFFFK